MEPKTAPEGPPRSSRTRSRHATWLGGATLVALALGVGAPRAVARFRDPPKHRSEMASKQARAAEHAEGEATRATAALASLTSALTALRDVRTRVLARDEKPVPPSPQDFPSTTACVRTYLPDVDIADSSLSVLCEEPDAWAAERALYARLSHRKGGEAWTRLGRHTLAALATLRNGCCVAPTPLTAVLPGLWCGVLRDELRAFDPAPDAPQIASYESMMRCLDARGVHLPERWKSRPEWITDRAFSAFLDVARHRSRR